MNFKLSKDKRHQLFFVDLEVVDITDKDRQKFDDFGIPTVQFKTRSGEVTNVKVTDINFLQSYGFSELEAAEEYYYALKLELKDLKYNWQQLGYDWDSEEII